MSGLSISGNHPAAAWLTICLRHRGWPITWQADKLPDLNPGAYHHGISEQLGRTNLAWPPEWCYHTLEGLLYDTPSGKQLIHWPVSLLDLSAIWHDLCCEAAAQTEGKSGDVKLELSFMTQCETACPTGQIDLSPEVSPTGFLIQTQDGWQTQLGPAQTQRIRLSAETNHNPPCDEVLCHCLPQLSLPSTQHLIWQMPLPNLLPESIVSQTLYWLLLQDILHGLSHSSLQPQYLHQQVPAIWMRLQNHLSKMAKTQKFMPIPK